MADAYQEEYQKIGGIEQYILHYPVENAPVMLLLHGGPGSAESNFSYLFHEWWGKAFSLVQWDQRGSGKTLHRNPDTSTYPITFESMRSDTQEVINYLKEKYNQEKIVIMGHSWGTVLGALHTLEHPEDVSLYIAVAQVVDMQKNEVLGLEKVIELATEAGDTKAVEKLNQVGTYPPTTIDKEGFQKVATVRKYQQKYGLAVGFTGKLIQQFRKSPVFRFSDLTTMVLKANKANMPLLDGHINFDLTKWPSRYEVPICCIQGERDYQSVTSLAIEYFEAAEAPAKQIHLIEEAGHNTMVDQPERFAAALKQAREMLDS